MTCLISTDGKVAVCGGFGRRKCHYFTKDHRAVLFCDSLWYEPHVVTVKITKVWRVQRSTRTVPLIRKKYERIDHFKVRVRKILKFMPLTSRGWWRVTAVPQLRDLKTEGA